MAVTQGRAFGAYSGAPYGSFAGRVSQRSIATYTQGRAFGAYSGAPYGSFFRGGAPRSILPFTQGYAFGAHSGAQYGTFGERGVTPIPPVPTPSPIGGGIRPPHWLMPIPPHIQEQLRLKQIEEDDALLLVLAMLAASGNLH